MQALQEAGRQAEEGASPQTEEQQQRAEELAQRQKEIREQLLALAKRNEERQSPLPQPDLSKPAQSASEAQESLEQGDLDEAEQRTEQTEREIREALDQLEREEQQYQNLRQEELLFRIAEEVDGLLKVHREQRRATEEIDANLQGRDKPSRSDRIRLRNIAREEETLAVRTGEIAAAIEAESALVFAEVLRAAEKDLAAIARGLGETGGYSTGARIQALQHDVETGLEWLADALREELQRRQDEQQQEQQQQQQQQQQQPGQQQAKDPLVPSVAELKLLRQLEVDLLERVELVLELYPELNDPETAIDPLVREDLERLAAQHRRIGELFKGFRENLGLPDPNKN
jgi:hypothetical protein